MSKKQLSKRLDTINKRMDRLYGMDASYNARVIGAFNPTTGAQTITDNVSTIRVRAEPITLRERADLSAAGVNQETTRWNIRKAEVATVKAGDILTIDSLQYEVQSEPSATLDEFELVWTVFAQRIRST